MLTLKVGDPHTKKNNLEDSQRLMEYTASVAIELQVDRIEILGDLFHTHSVIRMEVLNFWNDWLDRLSMICEVVVLVGNHDQSGSYVDTQHALEVFKHIPNANLHIIDKPTVLGAIAYVPYIHNQKEFVVAANGLSLSGAKVLVCHQTFAGSKYDNGMYAPDGFDPDLLQFDTVISGHIHMRQRFGKIIYPGTAKWDTLSDANEDKGLWLVEHAEDGSIVKEEFLDTSKICTPIYTLQWREGEEQPVIQPGRVTMELVGSSVWVKQQKENLKGKCGISSKVTDKVRKESRKPVSNLTTFVSGNFEPMTGVSRESILRYMKEKQFV